MHKDKTKLREHPISIIKQVITKFFQFLIPTQFPNTKQWWSKPNTQWLQCLQWEAEAGLIISQVSQYLYVKILKS
jgi:hypothetical protein